MEFLIENEEIKEEIEQETKSNRENRKIINSRF